MAEPLAFVYLLRPPRPDFIQTMTEDEGAIMEEHFAYLQALLHKEKLVLAGPALDGSFGIVVFHEATPEDARAVMDGDPAIARGIMSGELHPFRVSLLKTA